MSILLFEGSLNCNTTAAQECDFSALSAAGNHVLADVILTDDGQAITTAIGATVYADSQAAIQVWYQQDNGQMQRLDGSGQFYVGANVFGDWSTYARIVNDKVWIAFQTAEGTARSCNVQIWGYPV